STNWLTIISSIGLGSGNGSFTYTVAPNTNSINSRTAQFIITDTAVTGIATSIVTITQAGVPAPPLSLTFTIDGIAESTYGCPLSVQDIQTQFGDNTQTNLQNNTGG